MNCPYCGMPSMPEDAFCAQCGGPLYLPTAAAPQPLPPEPFHYPVKQGSHRVPLLIMAVMATLGLLLYFFSGTIESLLSQLYGSPWFENIDGTLYFNESLYTGGEELIVPEEVDGEPVLYLSEGCFASCEKITTVVLPKTLKSVSKEAFRDCTSLRGVFLADGLETIETEAFQGCTLLEAIRIPGSTEIIERRAFYGCDRLKYILYDETFAAWEQLYPRPIPSNPDVHCTDGTFPHN